MKYIVITFSGIIVVCLALMALVTAILDNDDYRKIAIGAVAHFTGYEMIIEGDFALDISRTSTLSASKIRFESPPGVPPFPITHIGKLNIKLALLPLITGTVVIKELSVDDVAISWVIGETQQDKTGIVQEDASRDIGIPVLEYVSLQNISIDLFDTNHDSLGIIKLRRFSIDDIRDMGPLFVKGEGGINANDFFIKGRLGDIVNAFSRSTPYPVEVSLESKDLNLDISGEVGDFIEGEGLDLNIVGDVAELSNLLQLFSVESPELGRMKFEAGIAGNIEAPRASDIHVTLSNGSKVELEAKGSVNDLANGTGLDIGVKGSSTDNHIIQMLLPGILSDLTKLKIKGNLRDHQEDYILEDITADASNDQGLEMSASGLLNFGDLTNNSFLKAIDLNLRANTQTTEAAKLFLVELLPEMGPVTGKARLVGPLDRLSLENLDVIIGGSLPLQVASQGRIAWIPIDDHPISGIDLNLSVRAERTELLASAFDIPMPELGSVSIDSRLFYSDERLEFNKIEARTSHPQGLEIELSGKVGMNFEDTHESPGDVNFELTVTAPSLGAAEPLLGVRTAPNMGPVQMHAKITGTPHVISLENILLTAGEPPSAFAKVHGRVDKIALGEEQPVSGLEIFGSLQAKETAEYASLMGVTIPNLGPLKGTWRLVNWEGGFDVEDMEFHIGKKETLLIKSTGEIKSLSRRGKISFAGFDVDLTAEAADITAIPVFSHVDLPDLGPLQMKARLVGSAKTLDIKNLMLRAGPKEKAAFIMKGEILTIENSEKIPLNVTFETYTQPWVEKYMKQSVPEDHKLLGIIKLACLPDHYRVEELKITTEGQKPLSMMANGIVKKTGSFFESDLAIAVEAKDPAVIESMFGIILPAFSPLAVKGRFRGNEKKADFEGETHFGKTHFETVVTHSETNRHRLKIKIKNSTPAVYLSDLGIYPKESVAEPEQKKKTRSLLGRLFSKGSAKEAAPDKKSESESGLIFSDEPMSLDGLKSFDLSLSLDADKLVGKDVAINNLDFDLVLDNGLLRISPAKLGYAEGAISFESTLDTTGEKPDFKLKATAEDVDMDTLLAHINRPITYGGNLNLAVDLHSSGSSPREIAESLTGEIGLAIENGKIKRDVEMLTADAVDMMTSLHKINQYQDLNCMTIRFIFDNGIGKSEVMFLDTPNVRTRGVGMINLTSETLEIVLQPKPKKGLPGLSSAVHINGPISNPSVRKMPFKEAARLYGEIFAPYIFLPVRALGYLWYLMKSDKDEESPCLNFAPSDEQ